MEQYTAQIAIIGAISASIVAVVFNMFSFLFEYIPDAKTKKAAKKFFSMILGLAIAFGSNAIFELGIPNILVFFIGSGVSYPIADIGLSTVRATKKD